MDFEAAVEILASGRPSAYAFEREIAYAVFSAALVWRWNADAVYGANLVSVGRIAEEYGRSDARLDASWLSRAISWPQITSFLCSDNFISLPLYVFDDDHDYDDGRYISDIVRFFLSYYPVQEDYQPRPSLGRAFTFLNGRDSRGRGGFHDVARKGADKSFYSRTAHDACWSRLKRYAAFLYVAHYDCEIDLRPDPRDDGYLSRLTEYSSQNHVVSSFFSKVLWVQNNMQSKLDRRSMAAKEYFKFPAGLIASACRVPKMTKGEYAQLSGYRKAGVSVDDDD